MTYPYCSISRRAPETSSASAKGRSGSHAICVVVVTITRFPCPENFSASPKIRLVFPPPPVNATVRAFSFFFMTHSIYLHTSFRGARLCIGHRSSFLIFFSVPGSTPQESSTSSTPPAIHLALSEIVKQFFFCSALGSISAIFIPSKTG